MGDKYLNLIKLFREKNINFSKLRNKDDISKTLFMETKSLDKFIIKNQKIFYKELKIPKKGFKQKQKFRIVYKANLSLSLIQKNIETSIRLNSKFPKYVHGFVSKRSIISNAKSHLNKNLILNADIKSFFKSIPFDKVVEVFENLGAPKKVSLVLAKLCTINNILEEGLSTSPIIANIVCRDMDQELVILGEKFKSKYTRYSDDIVFSSNNQLPSKNDIEKIFKKHGFLFNEKKFRICKKGRSQFVTGLSVCESDNPRISKKIKKNLRLEIYYSLKFGLKNHFKKRGIEYNEINYNKFKNRILGWSSFMHPIEPKLALQLFRAEYFITQKEENNFNKNTKL